MNIRTKLPSITGVIIILFFSVISFGTAVGYQYYMEATQGIYLVRVIEIKTDSHNCLISAGYAWCPTQNKCISVLRDKCN